VGDISIFTGIQENPEKKCEGPGRSRGIQTFIRRSWRSTGKLKDSGRYRTSNMGESSKFTEIQENPAKVHGDPRR
jgi:hypothetical protein